MDHSAQWVQDVKQLFCDGFPTQSAQEATNTLLKVIHKVAKLRIAMCLATFPVLKLGAMLWAASMGTSMQEFGYHDIYKLYFLHTLLLPASKLSQRNPKNDRRKSVQNRGKEIFPPKITETLLFFWLCRNANTTMRAFIWNFALVSMYSWTCKPEDSEQPCTPHHTRTAVYSCWVLVPAMSSPVVTSECFLRETLLSMNENIVAWERLKVCNEIWLASLPTNLLSVWG